MNKAEREKQRKLIMASREDIIDKCKIYSKEIMVKQKAETITKGPCARIAGTKCAAYIKPSVKWKNGNCGLATHLIYEEDEEKFKNPLKASKQQSRG